MKISDNNKAINFILEQKKYFISIIIFLAIILFFDQNNLFEQFKLNKELKSLKQQNEYYRKQIGTNKKRLKQLKTNKENLEKFAREQYLMKKPGEDVFVVIEE